MNRQLEKISRKIDFNNFKIKDIKNNFIRGIRALDPYNFIYVIPDLNILESHIESIKLENLKLYKQKEEIELSIKN